MRDPYLIIIALIGLYPDMPLKFYIDSSRISRGTFFKVKGHLEELEIITLNARKRLFINIDKGLAFLSDVYPGVTISLHTSSNELPMSDNFLQSSRTTSSSAL